MECHMRPPAVARCVLPVLAAVGCRNDAVLPTESAPIAFSVTSAATALAFSQLGSGVDFTCGVTPDSRAYCWGFDGHGGIGRPGAIGPNPKPSPVVTTLSFRQVSAGFYHACGVTPDNHAYCWGGNSYGELGDGTTTDHATPVPVAGGHLFRQVDAGKHLTCGVSYPDNRGYCWGDDTYGQLGRGRHFGSESHVPVALAGGLTFQRVSAGYVHACGITTTTQAYCWGNNDEGQLGDSTHGLSRDQPTRVAAGTRQFRQVEAGGGHTCAVTTTASAFCWGDGRQGQLGIGKAILSYWPRAVAGGLSFRRVTAAGGHTCGETTGSRAYCWGSNGDGELGDGARTTRLSPVPVAGGLSFAQVSAGAGHTCGKTSANVAYCWGDNSYGQLGDGTTTRRLNPRAVVGPS
jgi:alpha-tubulin suppressor-like RCC1 family protein